jgi:pilus assembly protein CpaC
MVKTNGQWIRSRGTRILEHDRLTRVWRRLGGGHTAGRAGHTQARLARCCMLAGLLALMAVAIGPVGGLIGGPALAQGQIVNISDGQRVGRIVVSVGKSETLRVSEPFENVVVGNPDIADVAPLTDQSLYLLGRTVGTTNLAVYNAERELIAVIDVEVTSNVRGLREALAAALPGQPIQIRSVGGRIMLQGAVLDAVMVDRAMQIAADFAGEGVTNALTVASPQQVMLEVRILEASRSLGKDLGVQWNSSTDGGRFRFSTLGGLTGAALPFGTLFANLLNSGGNIDVVIDALEDKGIARRLAEPNLTTLSGQPASFHAGGEFPVPVEGEAVLGDESREITQTVEFKPFGVRLSFTPTVLADGLINLLIEPEVSELDFANAVRNIPSVTTRRARTTVELRDGQSMALAGLLQTRHSRNINQVPWLGDVPILGALFRSSSFQKEETELVVIVTPRLVQPVPPGMELATPLDNLAPSNDPELVLFGELEVTKEHLHLIETGGNVRGPFGHMLDLPEGQRHVITK